MKAFKELSAVALSLLAATVFAHEGHEEAAEADLPEVPSDVKVLTTESFEPFVAENPLVLAKAMFFSFSLVAASSYSGASALQCPHQGA